MKIEVKQLSAMSMLVATASVVRVGISWAAFTVPIPAYGILVKLGLTETLTFVSGFVFGPIHGFLTGLLVIVVSDVFSWAGPWTPFIAAIIGTLGLLGGIASRFRQDPGVKFLGVMAVILTLASELLQNLWSGCYTWAFYTPEIPLVTVLAATFAGGFPTAIAAVVNNAVLFTLVAPRTILVLRKWVAE